MRHLYFYTFLPLYILALLYLAITLPIGPHEATLYYEGQGVLSILTHLCKGCFSNNLDFRLPFLLFGFLNIPLFYIMSRFYLDKKEESYLATTIFLLLPGIITSTVLVNIAVVVITLVLIFLIFYKQKIWVGVVLTMVTLLLIHDASIIFFIAIVVFSVYKRNSQLLIFSIILALVGIFYFNGLEIDGTPTGEFLQLFGLYIALFSPFVFLYFFYALYRIWLREEKNLLWFISFLSFIFSILLSLRQQVDMTDFAPYVIVSVVLMLVVYYKTFSVRLPVFQKPYRWGFNIVIGSLIISSLVTIFHQPLFYLLDDKSKHFAYPFYEPYWQVLELHEIEQNCYTVKKNNVQYQLKYYGIEKCEESTVPKIHRY